MNFLFHCLSAQTSLSRSSDRLFSDTIHNQIAMLSMCRVREQMLSLISRVLQESSLEPPKLAFGSSISTSHGKCNG